MQITVTLKKEKIILPIATFSTVQGLLYRALSGDASYSYSVHEKGKGGEGKKFKLFTFGELKGKYQVEGRQIVFLSRVSLTVRGVDPYLIQLLFSYFDRNEKVMLGENEVLVEQVKLEDFHVYESELEIRTCSPITVYQTEANGHTLYFSPQEEAFYESVVNNARRKWCSHYGSEDGFSLDILPRSGMLPKKCATRFKETFITAWHGQFVLKAPPQVLDFLYHTGLGSKNSQGFGMFSIINDEK